MVSHRSAGAAEFSGDPLILAPDPDPASDVAFLIARYVSGFQASREQLPRNGDPILWGGICADGSPLGNGAYVSS